MKLSGTLGLLQYLYNIGILAAGKMLSVTTKIINYQTFILEGAFLIGQGNLNF